MLECTFCDREAKYEAPIAPGFGTVIICEEHEAKQDWDGAVEL